MIQEFITDFLNLFKKYKNIIQSESHTRTLGASEYTPSIIVKYTCSNSESPVISNNNPNCDY